MFRKQGPGPVGLNDLSEGREGACSQSQCLAGDTEQENTGQKGLLVEERELCWDTCILRLRGHAE